ncbi:MAG: WYL domain-containing protein [Treponema sp.]|nr:WYL domain-containing protein [Treponema sp.]
MATITKSHKRTSPTPSKEEMQRAYVFDSLLSIQKCTKRKLIETYEDQCERTCGDNVFASTIRFMQDKFNAPIEIERSGNQYFYYYTDKTYRLPVLVVKESTLQSAKILRNLCSTFKGTPLYDSFRILEIMEESPIKNPMTLPLTDRKDGDASDVPDFSSLKSSFVFLDNYQEEIDAQVWEKVLKAISEKKTITFTYNKTDKDISERLVEPYQLIFSKNIWYLWCKEIPKDDYRVFSLRKIENIRTKNKTFILPPGYDCRNHGSNEFGPYYIENGEEWSFKIRFREKAIQRVLGHNLGKDIKEEWDGDDLILSFTNSNYWPVMELVMALNAWGALAIPLEPECFVKDWKETVRNMAKSAEIM